MAQSKKNIATEGLSGRVGNLIFRRRKSDDKIFVARRPVASEEEPTEAQKNVQRKFQRGIVYGSSAVADPATKALYAAKATGGRSAFNVAIADYFNAPQIEEINLDNYSGAVGSTIAVTVTDDFAVSSVHVKIENMDGSLVEEGEAVPGTSDVDWIYTATVTNENLAGDKITVTAYDMPGNTDQQENEIPAR
ncbi:MAG: hypothetical protein A2W90_12140 [Bacteroidetes bacterium GWF2_42_66]|nr:MAG: hypothetical protein A2W92_23285 [Bacteroidetes bacterium GWA2_42_15]OFX99940.1 MAG: hypothetical protein A2W89_17125 [Bacteroidetes bacterium GWE2_42_39]OFY40125.1 MAG: hypothetical protein A2W90_12140 [Bacteroidetes bacterium GWF2_42_66]HBL73949.1 hypothetical protein [Prolixibacteraceae bacterium]HCR89241.1 hypothetical protein [Prolixibacteraceae bacterium]